MELQFTLAAQVSYLSKGKKSCCRGVDVGGGMPLSTPCHYSLRLVDILREAKPSDAVNEVSAVRLGVLFRARSGDMAFDARGI
jgi:hypothetical protein